MKSLIWMLIIISISIASGQPAVYPLHTGDRWVFGASLPFIPTPERVTGDTLMPNGMRYAMIWYPPWVDYQRQMGSQVFQFDPEIHAEYLWYDFSVAPGDTVNIVLRENDSLVITLAYYRTAAVFGVNRRQWIFLFDLPGLIDDERFVVITDSLGITEIWMYHGSVSLRGAVINGVTYGDPSDVGEFSGRLPDGFRLEQNYPNPFNPVTSFEFRVPGLEFVQLRVFDVLGREVATLVNEKKEPGTYEMTWDASDQPSGVYFCRMSAPGFVQTRKLLLIR